MLKQLAKEIAGAQQPEIDAWAQLQNTSGKGFGIIFLQNIIEHHVGVFYWFI